MPITQSELFNATPEQVYTTLLSETAFSQFTGAPAAIAENAGGEFSCFGGQITGRHVELTPNERIVQAWRASAWPDGVYSIVRFDISARGESAKVELTHTGYPVGGEEHLEGGWTQMYWKPLHAHFG